jgi:hypothetical protein
MSSTIPFLISLTFETLLGTVIKLLKNIFSIQKMAMSLRNTPLMPCPNSPGANDKSENAYFQVDKMHSYANTCVYCFWVHDFKLLF